jgi:hypothetical protein
MQGALFEAYGRTTFVADTPRGRLLLRVGRRSAELNDLLAAHGVTTWAYVTAFNPGSRLLPAEANAARQRELERLVAARGDSPRIPVRASEMTADGRPSRVCWCSGSGAPTPCTLDGSSASSPSCTVS